MTVLRVDDFGGMAPAIDPRNLPANGAVLAVNTDPEKRCICPLKGGGGTSNLATGVAQDRALSLAWDEVVSGSVGVPVREKSDSAEWRIFDDGTELKARYRTNPSSGPSVAAQVGAPAPAKPVLVAATGSGTNHAYVITKTVEAGGFSMESKPSPPLEVETGSISDVAVRGTESLGTGEHYNLYRASGGKYLYSAKGRTDGDSRIMDDVRTADELGEEIPSIEWDRPTDVVNAVQSPHGFLVGKVAGSPDMLAFSEPGVFYAWPHKYRFRLPDAVVDMAVMGSQVFAVTESGVFILSGTHPDSISVRKALAPPIGKITGGRVCATNHGVFFWAADGIMRVDSAGGVTNLTRDIAGPVNFSRFSGAGRPVFRKGSLYANFRNTARLDDPGQVGAFHVERGEMVETSLSPLLVAEDGADVLTVVDGNVKYMFTGSPYIAKWKSKEFETPSLTGFTCMKVDRRGDAGSTCRVEVWRDGEPLWADALGASTPLDVTDSKPFRLPPGRGLVWQFEVNTDCEVTAVTLATSMKELSHV